MDGISAIGQGSRELNNRLVQGTQKFGSRSLVVWGCMLWEGPGFAARIDGRWMLTSTLKFWRITFSQACSFTTKTPRILFSSRTMIQSKKAKEWFQTNGFNVMSWPAQCPDLNPIEHLWDHLKRRLGEYENAPGGMQELWKRVKVEWDKIEGDTCQKLIESMPRRVDTVIREKLNIL